ncbi:hypothetical protein [Aeromicrobium sp.]|uniref:hypothetical protein n=1 Tax=Aeromicrobium sp. TaxID=1871063 RepID=UPI0019A3B22A|nr:hypothetical protein [Aeromicrobium sp.]MBC7631191.1 hypothetical protein [Aeromicrobium sp.]
MAKAIAHGYQCANQVREKYLYDVCVGTIVRKDHGGAPDVRGPLAPSFTSVSGRNGDIDVIGLSTGEKQSFVKDDEATKVKKELAQLLSSTVMSEDDVTAYLAGGTTLEWGEVHDAGSGAAALVRHGSSSEDFAVAAKPYLKVGTHPLLPRMEKQGFTCTLGSPINEEAAEGMSCEIEQKVGENTFAFVIDLDDSQGGGIFNWQFRASLTDKWSIDLGRPSDMRPQLEAVASSLEGVDDTIGATARWAAESFDGKAHVAVVRDWIVSLEPGAAVKVEPF